MKPLRDRIAELIEATGPISVADYMSICLFDPQAGYYMTRDPLGLDGDFTTAPEISQMFGELIGAWLVEMWRRSGRPQRPQFAEIGPGRGTLSKDIARTIDRLEPKLRSSASYALIEISPSLKAKQAATLSDVGGNFHWVSHLGELPAGQPLFIVGNELFDAIPFRQFVKTEQGWRERCVGLNETRQLQFVAGAAALDPTALPLNVEDGQAGLIFELAPARNSLMETIAERIARDGGAGLFIDYGHLQSGLGDTLQALVTHKFHPPLENPGDADLTSHVDFAALATSVKRAGLEPHVTTQGDFLLGLGLLARAGQLGAKASLAQRTQLQADVQRLAGPAEMGSLFKVIGFAAAPGPLPGFNQQPT